MRCTSDMSVSYRISAWRGEDLGKTRDQCTKKFCIGNYQWGVNDLKTLPHSKCKQSAASDSLSYSVQGWSLLSHVTI